MVMALISVQFPCLVRTLATPVYFNDFALTLPPYRVEMRDRTNGETLLSIGDHGELGFRFAGERSLRRVEETLRFLSHPDNESDPYVEWPTEMF